MELRTFGGVLKHALELEEKATAFYDSACTTLSDQTLMEKLDSLSEKHKKRQQNLLRVRREHVTEMILEPIHGLDAENYSPSISIPEDADSQAIVELAFELELKLHKFYSDGAVKINFLIEAADAFERLADENSDIITMLQT